MTIPRITALIDTYNHSRFIEEAIESVLAQDFPAAEMEVIVVDDGSTDDTAARVKLYADAGRVRLICKPNGGQASAFNVGFQHARGEIVALLDGDDLWLPQKLRRVAQEFDRHPDAGMVYHPNENWDMQRNVSVKEAGFTPICGNVAAKPDSLLRYGNFSTSGMAVKRSVLQALYPIPETLRIYADTFLVIVVPFVSPVAGINDCLTRYRQHGGNLTAFRGSDEARTRQRWRYFRTGILEARHWLEQNGYEVQQPHIRTFLRPFELYEEMLRFQVAGASRREYFRYLREHQQLYAPLLGTRYQMFRWLVNLSAVLLGYRVSEKLRNSYRQAKTLLTLREILFPSQQARSSKRSAEAQEETP